MSCLKLYILVCETGYFGKKCLRECSSSCKRSTCRHTDGWCICAPGFTADNCSIQGKILFCLIVNMLRFRLNVI